jgi:hypothetical protein
MGAVFLGIFKGSGKVVGWGTEQSHLTDFLGKPDAQQLGGWRRSPLCVFFM